MALVLAPPTPRRGLLLIDPSYEVKDDYEVVPKRIAAIRTAKWNVGTILVWYPILVSGAHRPMIEALAAAVPSGVLHEVMFPPAKEGHRMIGSGLFAVNPPYLFLRWGRDVAAKVCRLTRHAVIGRRRPAGYMTRMFDTLLRRMLAPPPTVFPNPRRSSRSPR